MLVLLKRRHKKSDCKIKTAACSNCGNVGRLREVCRNTNTHETEKDADEPNPDVTVEAVWCLAVRDTVDDDHFDHTERHERGSEHRDGLSCGKIITNIGTGQNSERVITNISIDAQDSDRRHNSRHLKNRSRRVDGSKIGWNTQEFVTNTLMDQKMEQETWKELMAKSLMDRTLNQDDGVKEQMLLVNGKSKKSCDHLVVWEG